jgi:hypothetical protein
MRACRRLEPHLKLAEWWLLREYSLATAEPPGSTVAAAPSNGRSFASRRVGLMTGRGPISDRREQPTRRRSLRDPLLPVARGSYRELKSLNFPDKVYKVKTYDTTS